LNFVARSASLFITIITPFFLIMTAINLLITPSFAWVEYHLPGFPDDPYGLTQVERIEMSKFAINYLRNQEGIEYLGNLTFRDGTVQYNERELDHMGRFLGMARDYARKNGFKGTFLIEPKPMEPSKHQYDFDVATIIGFLKAHGLDKDFKLNIEVNHATLAGHTFQHELQVAADAGLLGSIDANKGDYQNGWDTDEFPTNVYEITEAMMVILQAGGDNGF